MATGSSRFRPRPIDYDRPLPVVRSQHELELNEDGILVPKKDLLTESIDDVDEVKLRLCKANENRCSGDFEHASYNPCLFLNDSG